MKAPDWISVAARKKGGFPPEWEWSDSRIVGLDFNTGRRDGYLVTGGVPRTITRGKNKGKKRWDRSAMSEVFITVEEAREAREAVDALSRSKEQA